MKTKKLLRIFIPILLCVIIAIIIFKPELLACFLVTIVGLALIIFLGIKGFKLLAELHLILGLLVLILAFYCGQAVIGLWGILL